MAIHHRRPREGADDTPCRCWLAEMLHGLLRDERRWLWVPAFAGPTILSLNYLRSTAIVRLAKVSRSAITETK